MVVYYRVMRKRKNMKNVVLSLVSLLMFVGCDIEFPTSGVDCSSENGGCELDYNPFMTCEDPLTYAHGEYYCCCIEGATNYSEYEEGEHDYNCDVSDSTYCDFE